MDSVLAALLSKGSAQNLFVVRCDGHPALGPNRTSNTIGPAHNNGRSNENNNNSISNTSASSASAADSGENGGQNQNSVWANRLDISKKLLALGAGRGIPVKEVMVWNTSAELEAKWKSEERSADLATGADLVNGDTKKDTVPNTNTSVFDQSRSSPSRSSAIAWGQLCRRRLWIICPFGSCSDETLLRSAAVEILCARTQECHPDFRVILLCDRDEFARFPRVVRVLSGLAHGLQRYTLFPSPTTNNNGETSFPPPKVIEEPMEELLDYDAVDVASNAPDLADYQEQVFNSDPSIEIVRFNPVSFGRGDVFIRIMRDALKFNYVVHTLDLTGSKGGDSICSALTSILRTTRKLNHLVLNDCSLTDAGTLELSTALRKNSAVLSLSISKNPQITDVGIISIASIFGPTSQSRLEGLDLSLNNRVFDVSRQWARAALATLWEGLSRHPYLKYLSVSGCGLCSHHIVDMCDRWLGRYVSPAGHSSSEAHAVDGLVTPRDEEERADGELADGASNPTGQLGPLVPATVEPTGATTTTAALVFLDVSQNTIGDAAVGLLMQSLPQTLKRLSLEHVSIGAAGYRAVGHAILSKKLRLEELNLSHNNSQMLTRRLPMTADGDDDFRFSESEQRSSPNGVIATRAHDVSYSESPNAAAAAAAATTDYLDNPSDSSSSKKKVLFVPPALEYSDWARFYLHPLKHETEEGTSKDEPLESPRVLFSKLISPDMLAVLQADAVLRSVKVDGWVAPREAEDGAMECLLLSYAPEGDRCQNSPPYSLQTPSHQYDAASKEEENTIVVVKAASFSPPSVGAVDSFLSCLKGNRTLRSLNLAASHITDDNVRLLCDTITHDACGLQELDLSYNNKLGEPSSHKIKEMLELGGQNATGTETKGLAGSELAGEPLLGGKETTCKFDAAAEAHEGDQSLSAVSPFFANMLREAHSSTDGQDGPLSSLNLTGNAAVLGERTLMGMYRNRGLKRLVLDHMGLCDGMLQPLADSCDTSLPRGDSSSSRPASLSEATSRPNAARITRRESDQMRTDSQKLIQVHRLDIVCNPSLCLTHVYLSHNTFYRSGVRLIASFIRNSSSLQALYLSGIWSSFTDDVGKLTSLSQTKKGGLFYLEPLLNVVSGGVPDGSASSERWSSSLVVGGGGGGQGSLVASRSSAGMAASSSSKSSSSLPGISGGWNRTETHHSQNNTWGAVVSRLTTENSLLAAAGDASGGLGGLGLLGNELDGASEERFHMAGSPAAALMRKTTDARRDAGAGSSGGGIGVRSSPLSSGVGGGSGNFSARVQQGEEARYPPLRVLDLSDNDFSPVVAMAFAKAIQCNTNIRKLVLLKNPKVAVGVDSYLDAEIGADVRIAR